MPGAKASDLRALAASEYSTASFPIFQSESPVENIEAGLAFIEEQIGRSNVPVIKLVFNCVERNCENVLNERSCRCLPIGPPPVSKFLSRALIIAQVARKRETNTWSVFDCVDSEIEFLNDQILESGFVRQSTAHIKKGAQLVPIRPAARKHLCTNFEHEPLFSIHRAHRVFELETHVVTWEPHLLFEFKVQLLNRQNVTRELFKLGSEWSYDWKSNCGRSPSSQCLIIGLSERRSEFLEKLVEERVAVTHKSRAIELKLLI
jgi:hypothetical protein